MADIQEVNNFVRNFTAIRTQARADVETEANRLREQAKALTEQATNILKEFNEEWKNKKAEKKAELDKLAILELAGGKKPQTILEELNINNRQWIYDLSAKVKAGNYTVDENELVQEAQALDNETVWLYHDHAGVHRYLLSADHSLVKVWGTPGSEHEDQYVITDRDGVFTAGNLDFYQTLNKPNIKKRAEMLEQLLTGTYTRKINDATPNEWTH